MIFRFKANGRFASIAIEFINRIRTVQAFATQDGERQRFYQTSSDVVSTSIKSCIGLSIERPLAEGQLSQFSSA